MLYLNQAHLKHHLGPSLVLAVMGDGQTVLRLRDLKKKYGAAYRSILIRLTTRWPSSLTSSSGCLALTSQHRPPTTRSGTQASRCHWPLGNTRRGARGSGCGYRANCRACDMCERARAECERERERSGARAKREPSQQSQLQSMRHVRESESRVRARARARAQARAECEREPEPEPSASESPSESRVRAEREPSESQAVRILQGSES
jgi:hypothetical protein